MTLFLFNIGEVRKSSCLYATFSPLQLTSQYPRGLAATSLLARSRPRRCEASGLVSQDGATASISVLSFAWLAQQAWLSRTAFGAERSSHARRSPPRMMPQQNKIRALDSYSLRSGYRFLTASYKARALWINEIIAHANPATQARPTTGTKIKNKTTIHVRRKRAAATLLRSSDAGGTVESKASLPRLGWHPAKLLCL
jgi:hypothetical protein